MILCCGEALIDMLPTTDQAGKASFTPHVGGAVFNTAIALGRLRVLTGFISGISSDLFGELLKAALAGSNVDAEAVITSDRPTTLAFVQLTEGHASYTFYDENTAGRCLDPDDLPEIGEAVTAMYFGGISLISEPASEFYTRLAEREANNRVIVVDPNIRAGFITGEATYRARLDRIIAAADILKVSDEDLNWIIREPVSLKEKVALLKAKGPKVLILTRGGAGASAATPNGDWVDVKSKQVEVVDTVGAGDTFNAGVLASLSERGLLTKNALEDISADGVAVALNFGASVAAITVSRAGSNPPWAKELADA